MMSRTDALVDDDAEPDNATAPFVFMLDLHEPANHDCLDTGRFLPTQIAQRLAPAQVVMWLSERPEPDTVAFRRVPLLSPEPTQ
jgi:hypothetical protein